MGSLDTFTPIRRPRQQRRNPRSSRGIVNVLVKGSLLFSAAPCLELRRNLVPEPERLQTCAAIEDISFHRSGVDLKGKTGQ